MTEYTYIESKRFPGMYNVYDARGNLCGWVNQETKDNYEASKIAEDARKTTLRPDSRERPGAVARRCQGVPA